MNRDRSKLSDSSFISVLTSCSVIVSLRVKSVKRQICRPEVNTLSPSHRTINHTFSHHCKCFQDQQRPLVFNETWGLCLESSHPHCLHISVYGDKAEADLTLVWLHIVINSFFSYAYELCCCCCCTSYSRLETKLQWGTVGLQTPIKYNLSIRTYF